MALTVILFVAGLGAWTLLEYVIHGLLSHQLQTFAGPLHDVHHRDPHRVFTIRAWLPVAGITLAGLGFFGLTPVLIFVLGLVSGFVAYEAEHYRIHFRRPRNRLEARLRARHLAHHVQAPNAIFGVTTPFWDIAFGTEPARARMRELEKAVEGVAPLAGPSNWKQAFTVRIARISCR
ncbi:MAG TPA: sterol desaturase family protein [Candidatus Binataceae bacterium]|nr:sterol desaturase family protein [Candidatus Binataceae bacterium]